MHTQHAGLGMHLDVIERVKDDDCVLGGQRPVHGRLQLAPRMFLLHGVLVRLVTSQHVE